MTSGLGIFSLSNVADVLGIAGFIVTMATFWRVQRISQARQAERELLSKALRLQDLNSALAADAETLDGQATPRQQELVRSDLLMLSAELEAATRILVPSSAGESTGIPGADVIRDGYWTDAFADTVANRATRRLIIVTWRNSRALSVGQLETMFNRLAKYPRLQIEIFAVACDAADEVYEGMSRMLPLGNAALMRREQLHYRDTMVDIISERLAEGSLTLDVVQRIQYKETRIGPVLHCVVVDDETSWGINFFMDPGSGSTDLLDRAYVRSTTRSEFGRKVMEQVNVLRMLKSTTEFNLTGDGSGGRNAT